MQRLSPPLLCFDPKSSVLLKAYHQTVVGAQNSQFTFSPKVVQYERCYSHEPVSENSEFFSET